MLNFDLSAEQIALQQTARKFAIEEVLPIAWHYDRIGEFPLSILEKAIAAGLTNADIPARFGGKGYGILEGVIITEEIAAACPGLATSIFDNSLGMQPVFLCDNEVLKETVLPDILKNNKKICFATSEPFMGSDIAGIRCKAEKDGEDYLLNGTKYWITNGGIADYICVFATIDSKMQHNGICAFLVEKKWPGVTCGRPIPKLGQRASNTVGLEFKDVRVPKENILAPPGKGFVLAMRTFARTRPAIGALSVGAARSAMEYAIDYVKKRRAFGAAIASYQGIQFKIAEMYQKVETARLLTWKAAWEADSKPDATISASVAKLYASEIALEVANEALQVFGGYGYTPFFPVEKLLRDTRLFRIYEGTSEVQRIILAGHAMGAYRPVMPPLEDLPMIRETAWDELSADERGHAGVWRCRMCGHMHHGETPPEKCPYCFMAASTFKKIEP
ncbi:MAG: acyl-CoA dehydrogenase family protein [Desulfobacterales bacterium]|jgi:acyl-CoA dehydrogenase|nr:acyl-CoA dehydrogenase family protein [Desulfobacterales bacterium]